MEHALTGLEWLGSKSNTGFRYILVVINSFNKIGWTVLLKNRTSRTKKDTFEVILISSHRKPNLIESDDGKNLVKKFLIILKRQKNITRYSRYTSKEAVFAERFNRTNKDLTKRPVIGKTNATWIDVRSAVTKQCNNNNHSSSKLTPIQASIIKIERIVYNFLLDKRKKSQFFSGELVRIADQTSNFFEVILRWYNKLDLYNYIYNIYKIRYIQLQKLVMTQDHLTV